MCLDTGTHNVVARLICVQIVPAVKVPVDKVDKALVAPHQLDQPGHVVLVSANVTNTKLLLQQQNPPSQ